MKDAVANTFKLIKKYKLEKYPDFFSYSGSINHFPDFIISKGDAYEIKKNKTMKKEIQLNNSYPKDMLYSDDNRITKKCKNCEGENKKWEKDVNYVFGVVTKDNIIKDLFIAQGRCFAAKREYYIDISEKIRNKINDLANENKYKSMKTKELGRLNNIDKLQISSLRVRPMWLLQNPRVYFSDKYPMKKNTEFNIGVIMTKEKYETLPSSDIDHLEKFDSVKIDERIIKNPNTSKPMKAIIISAYW